MKPSRSIKLAAYTGITVVIASACMLTWLDRPSGTSAAGLLAIQGAAASPAPVTAADDKELAEVRQSGRQADAAQIGKMIRLLKNPPHPSYMKAALHSLAQLGATEALPTIDEEMQGESDADIRSYSVAARARLQAENAAQGVQDSDIAAQTKIRVFYQVLGTSAAGLNSGLEQHHDLITKQAFRIQTTAEVYAVRELADMVYDGQYTSFASLPGVSEVNYSQDYPSALKIRLSSLPPKERVNTMIQRLAQETEQAPNDAYDLQLLANEGTLASQAAVAKLREMSTQRSKYTYIGFSSLFEVIRGTGDKSQAAFVERFRHDADGRVAHYAEADYYDIEDGVKHQYVPGY
jgi:hypothetical protein